MTQFPSSGAVTHPDEIQTVTIPHTEYATALTDEEIHRINLEAGETLEVYRLDFQQKGGGTSASAEVEVYDSTNATQLSAATLGATDAGSSGSPLATSGDGATVLIRMDQSTGSTISASITLSAKVVS